MERNFKKIIFLFLFLFFTTNLFGKHLNFSIEPELSITTGNLGEYLYTPANDRILSYLKWQESPTLSLGAVSKINLYKLNFELSGYYTLPFLCGKMTDSDWNLPDVKTNLGIFNNFNHNSCGGDFIISYDFISASYPQFIFSPKASFKYKFNSFKGKNGQGWYGDDKNSLNGKTVSWDSEFARKVRLYGIDYTRNSFFIFTGFSEQLIFENFSAAFTFLISPYQLFYSKDFHYGNPEDNSEFSTIGLQKGTFEAINLIFASDYKISKKFKTNFKLDFLLCNLLTGETATNHYRNDGFGFLSGFEWMLVDQQSGGDIIEFTFSFGFEYLW